MSATLSFNLDELPVGRLIQISQGLGHQAEKIRAQRVYLRQLIDQRLAAGERQVQDGDTVVPGVTLAALAAIED